MATRRHRIVIKPNIRPAPAKTGPTSTPKQKTPSSVASECPSPAVRSQLVPLPHDETHQPSANEDDKDGDTVFNGDVSKQLVSESAAVPPEDKAAPVAELGGADSERDVLLATIKSKSEVCSQVESTHTVNEKAAIDVQSVSADDVLAKESSCLSAKPDVNTGTPVHKKTTLKSVTLETTNLAIKQKDKIDSEEVIKDVEDDNGATPSETDGSCMSDVMSLDPDNERREEVGDKAHKKPRRNKSKKLRSEPLPSREKSPDRQKMKMSDLLCWNPQQNSLPKKNKKKTVVRNESSPASPAPSLTAIDDDKESTNQSTSLPAPQVMIGPDGNVILNTESLIIQTQKDDGPKEVLEDNDEDRYLNTNSYRKYKKAKLWTEIETEQFFVGLSMCGTDFSLLTNLLTNRSRRELKNKFHREERRNRELIDKALSTRQQYDLTPFKRMAAEEDKKVKKGIKNKLKKEALKDEKGARRPKKKRKKESEDEDDWMPDYDEEDEENKNAGSDLLSDSLVKQKSNGENVKRETEYQSKSKALDQSFPGVLGEDKDRPFLPGYPTASVPSAEDRPTSRIPVPDDLDNPRMRSKPTKTYSKLSTQVEAGQQPSTNFTSNSNVIQTIPGSTQVQIEMDGVQSPVQGVLIPSHMVPHIAPQLGIHGSAAGMQVLLVQEETESGSLVHVYVLPESDTVRGSGDNVDGGLSGSGSHLSFTSPIPSPHPPTSIPSPQPASPYPATYSPHPAPPYPATYSPHPASPYPVSPYPATYSPHPLSSVCSPQPNPPFQSPPTLLNPTPGDHVQRPHPPMYTPLQSPHSTPGRPSSDTLPSHQIMPPPALNNPISRPSKNASTVQNSSTATCQQTAPGCPDNPFPHTNPATHCTSLSAHTSSLPHDTPVAISYQTTPSVFSHGSELEIIVVVEGSQTVKAGEGVAGGTTDNSRSTVPVPSVEADDDCIIVNTNTPQSQVEMSGVIPSVEAEDDCIIVNTDTPQSRVDMSGM